MLSQNNSMRKIKDKKIATKTQANNKIEDTVAETTEETEAELAIVIVFTEVEGKIIQSNNSN